MIKQPNLEDAHTMSILHSSSFKMPSKTQFERLEVGDFVKVNAQGEMFWCRIYFINGEDLIGIIDNELVKSNEHNLFQDDLIYLKIVNIYEINPDRNREKLPKFMVLNSDNDVYVMHTHRPKFIGKLITDKPLRMKDVFIIDEPLDYEQEMPKLLKDMADWFFYKFVKK